MNQRFLRSFSYIIHDFPRLSKPYLLPNIVNNLSIVLELFDGRLRTAGPVWYNMIAAVRDLPRRGSDSMIPIHERR